MLSDPSSSCLLHVYEKDTSPHLKYDSSSSNLNKEILGPHKTLDLPYHKIILEKTSGPNKNSRFSHLESL